MLRIFARVEEAIEAVVEAAVEAEIDAVEEAEDPVAVFREQMRTAPGDWYVIHSYAWYENKVKGNIETRISTLNMEDYIFQVEVPMEEVTEIKGGVRKLVRRNKFPGYVLVRMEQAGICVDAAYLHELSHKVTTRIAMLEQEIFAIADHKFNIAFRGFGRTGFKSIFGELGAE